MTDLNYKRVEIWEVDKKNIFKEKQEEDCKHEQEDTEVT